VVRLSVCKLDYMRNSKSTCDSEVPQRRERKNKHCIHKSSKFVIFSSCKKKSHLNVPYSLPILGLFLR